MERWLEEISRKLKTFGFLEPRKRLRNDSKQSTKFLLGKRGDAVKGAEAAP